MINSDETTFLSELSDLFGTCEAVQQPRTTVEPDNLLCASRQLVAETEALLSSCSTRATNDKTRNAAKRRLKYCKKIESERTQLKQQEKELTIELAELQAMHSENQLVFEKTRTMPVWKAIATRQLQSRIVAEAEQRRLRTIVATRSKLLQEIGEKVHKYLTGPDAPLHSGSSMRIESADVVLFERFLQEVDNDYSQVANILNAWGINDAPLYSFHPDAKRLRNGNVEYFESLALQMTPFDYQKTGAALWKSMQLLHQQKSSHYQGALDPENTIAVKFRVPGKNDAVWQSVRMVFRKRVEAERIVILWRAHTQGEGELSDFHADETGWSIVRPTDARTRNTTGMPTAIVTFIRFIPNGESTEDKSKVGEFLQLAERSGNEDGSELARMMESLLLDDSRLKPY